MARIIPSVEAYHSLAENKNSTVVVLQPGYLPWLGFFDQMNHSDVFVFYDDVQFDMHGWRNRNRIKSPKGMYWLTVPVRHSGLGKPLIKDTEIDNRMPWARKHIGTIRQFYNQAPYLKRYLPELEEVLYQTWNRIVDLDLVVVKLMCSWLKIQPKIVKSSELNISGEKNERLLKISQHFHADRYFSGDSSKNYLDVDLFKTNGIKVEWQNYKHPNYPQQHGTFIPYLSCLDLLLNCGDESLNILTQQNGIWHQ